MFMNGTILDAEMNEFFSGVDINLYDVDERQTYKAQIIGGLVGLDELMQLKKVAMKKGGVTDEELEQAAAQVEMPPLFQPMSIRVRRVKTNKAGFTTLICDLSQ
jgi:hypothetical protein